MRTSESVCWGAWRCSAPTGRGQAQTSGAPARPWTAGSFLDHARRVSLAARLGHHARVPALARSAEPLYAGPFRADDDDSAWAAGTREGIEWVRHAMLYDAATSAPALRPPREAASPQTQELHLRLLRGLGA